MEAVSEGEAREKAGALAERLLSNPVIEDAHVRATEAAR
ncbi:MAG: phosphoribosylformylglycinamidine synthase subunit PurS [Terracidiphilus sp.]